MKVIQLCLKTIIKSFHNQQQWKWVDEVCYHSKKVISHSNRLRANTTSWQLHNTIHHMLKMNVLCWKLVFGFYLVPMHCSEFVCSLPSFYAFLRDWTFSSFGHQVSDRLRVLSPVQSSELGEFRFAALSLILRYWSSEFGPPRLFTEFEAPSFKNSFEFHQDQNFRVPKKFYRLCRVGVEFLTVKFSEFLGLLPSLQVCNSSELS